MSQPPWAGLPGAPREAPSLGLGEWRSPVRPETRKAILSTPSGRDGSDFTQSGRGSLPCGHQASRPPTIARLKRRSSLVSELQLSTTCYRSSGSAPDCGPPRSEIAVFSGEKGEGFSPSLACMLAAGLEDVFPADGLLKVLLLEPPEEEASNDPALGHLEGAGGDAGGVTHSCGKRSGSRPK